MTEEIEKPKATEVNVAEKKEAELKHSHKHGDGGKDLHKLMEEKEKILKEKEERYLRLRADFENYKKRTAAEREEIVTFSNEVLIVGLLPVLDNFERAMEAVNTIESDKKVEDFLKGIALVHRHMLDTFTKMGLEEIQAVGKPFDPMFHEAALHRPDGANPADTVIEVLQKGYLFKGKVVRHAMVVVSKKE